MVAGCRGRLSFDIIDWWRRLFDAPVSTKQIICIVEGGNVIFTNGNDLFTIVEYSFACLRVSLDFDFTNFIVSSIYLSYGVFGRGFISSQTNFRRRVGWLSVISGYSFSVSVRGLGNFIMFMLTVSLEQGQIWWISATGADFMYTLLIVTSDR
jgi:hypothetical protein